jgi:hypothetical protein
MRSIASFWDAPGSGISAALRGTLNSTSKDISVLIVGVFIIISSFKAYLPSGSLPE